MLCNKCNSELPPEALFCNQCGTKVAISSPAKADPPSGVDLALGCLVSIGYILLTLASLAMGIYFIISFFPFIIALLAVFCLFAIIANFLPENIKDKLATYETLRPFLKKGKS